LLYLKLPKENFDAFFENLKSFGRIYGPVKTGASFHAFKEVSSAEEMDLSYTRTMIPPKKFFVKPIEKIFEFDEEKTEFREVFEETERVVVFGVHHCDINAIKLLDKVYLDELPDKYYWKRRENTFLIGYDCYPDEYCFCKSMGTSYAMDGFDIFLHELSDGYLVRVASEKGQEIIARS